MSEGFIGEIRIFAGTYAPQNWAFCDGRLMAINDNQALFSLLGTAYGGDGRVSFGLPDMRGRLPMHFGTGPGLTPRAIGSRFGTEEVTLTTAEMPNHTHLLQASTTSASSVKPNNQVLAQPLVGFYAPQEAGAVPEELSPYTMDNNNGGDSHSNMMPSLGVNFIICTQGLYPSRN
ncbi:phage tail protein [Paraferrimonas sp. SM1919]|uniref:phage tail protein n=1 Tax=Paraferrimonas sp. SM1919 TaxID=2662263 RepID=UPI0013D74301|nr:tail fiber protein [Paraferrimonas sp. SM1919]